MIACAGLVPKKLVLVKNSITPIVVVLPKLMQLTTGNLRIIRYGINDVCCQ